MAPARLAKRKPLRYEDGASRGARSPRQQDAALAQLVEHLIRNEGVGGSNPSSGTSFLTSTQPQPTQSHLPLAARHMHEKRNQHAIGECENGENVQTAFAAMRLHQ